jgi:nitrate reductase gamma subunit
MSLVTVVYGLLFYFAFLILVIGLAYRIYEYAKVPAPLKIPTPPAPKTKQGVAVRIFREVVLFESLFHSTKWTWLFGWLFHFTLLLAAFRHLRYFTDPVWFWVSWEIVQAAGHYGGYIMVLALFGLLGRRVFVDRVRYISSPSDFVLLLHLGLVIALMIVFPYSKLLHAPGLFFSPTRNQTDTARDNRHIADWAKKLETHK